MAGPISPHRDEETNFRQTPIPEMFVRNRLLGAQSWPNIGFIGERRAETGWGYRALGHLGFGGVRPEGGGGKRSRPGAVNSVDSKRIVVPAGGRTALVAAELSRRVDNTSGAR